MFKTHFDDYVCLGDSIECTVDGIDYVARIEFDGDSRPEDSDCYSQRKINEWNRNEWFFCSVVISASKNDIEIDDHCASLSGIECNFNNRGNKYLREVANEMLEEAISSAKESIEDTIQRLSA